MWRQEEESASFYQVSDQYSSDDENEPISDFDFPSNQRRHSNASSVREKSTSDDDEEQ